MTNTASVVADPSGQLKDIVNDVDHLRSYKVEVLEDKVHIRSTCAFKDQKLARELADVISSAIDEFRYITGQNKLNELREKATATAKLL